MKYDKIKRSDSLFPKALLNIKNPPEVLYFIGDITLASAPHCIGVVGARRATKYGKMVAEKIGRRLAENDIVTVSGLATGIDSCAHIGALGADGKTIAVLGTSIDICYPEANHRLKSMIEETGLVLSEYEGDFAGTKYSFPYRNRIISGLSEAVVVVEAGLKSGSLITAELAAEQGRTVFAVPGNITSAMSLGTNKLIRDGAIALSCEDDLISDLGLKKSIDVKEIERLGEDEKSVVAFVYQNGECTIDEIAFGVRISTQKIYEIVTILEMKGILLSSMGKIFIAKW